MLRFTRGNLLEDPVEVVVNTVNEVGVMGVGERCVDKGPVLRLDDR